MVVKIQPAAKSLSNALEYNERKADGVGGILDAAGVRDYLNGEAVGHVVTTVNVPDVSTLENEFLRLKLKNERTTRGRKLENPAFHMSINPGENDLPMDEKTLVSFAHEVMTQLGYGDNPYRIYRHDDTGRTHYHIVSTRIGQDGKKIKDSFENARCENICKGLASKYGYVLGLQDKPEEGLQPAETEERPVPPTPQPEAEDQVALAGQNHERKKQDEKKKFVPPFKLDGETPATIQYADIHAEAMTWSFTTPEQYGALLRWRFNTEAKLYNDEIYFIGLDARGNGCTPPVESAGLGIPAFRDVLQRCADTDIKKRKRQRERLENIVSWAADRSKDWESYRKLLERKGVYLAVSWTDGDEPFGVTWIDRGTKCIWKGSETTASLVWLKETCESRGWTMTRHWKYERKQRPQIAAPKLRTDETALPAPASGSLSAVSAADALKELMTIHGVKQSRRSNADASKNGGKLKYGEEDNKIDVII